MPPLGGCAPCTTCLSYGLSVQFQLVSVVDQAVQQGIGDRWIADVVVPQIDRQLAGQDGGAPAVAILQDLQHVPPLSVGERGEVLAAE